MATPMSSDPLVRGAQIAYVQAHVAKTDLDNPAVEFGFIESGSPWSLARRLSILKVLKRWPTITAATQTKLGR